MCISKIHTISGKGKRLQHLHDNGVQQQIKKEFKWRKLIKAYKVAHYNNAQSSSTTLTTLTTDYSLLHSPLTIQVVGWLHA